MSRKPASSSRRRTVDVAPRLARLIWVASRFDGVTEADLPAWTEDNFGLRIEMRDIRDSVRPLRPPNSRGRPRKHRQDEPVERDPALIDWLMVEQTPQLPLLSLLIEISVPEHEGPASLVRDVEALDGVRHVVETHGADRKVLAIATVRDMLEADRLEARARKLVTDTGGVRVRTIKHESQWGARATWRGLASREAADTPPRQVG